MGADNESGQGDIRSGDRWGISGDTGGGDMNNLWDDVFDWDNVVLPKECFECKHWWMGIGKENKCPECGSTMIGVGIVRWGVWRYLMKWRYDIDMAQ